MRAVKVISDLWIIFQNFSLKSHSLLSILYLQCVCTYASLKQVPRDTVESSASEMFTAQLAKTLSKPTQLQRWPCSEWGLGPDALQTAPADRIDYWVILLFTVMAANNAGASFFCHVFNIFLIMLLPNPSVMRFQCFLVFQVGTGNRGDHLLRSNIIPN